RASAARMAACPSGENMEMSSVSSTRKSSSPSRTGAGSGVAVAMARRLSRSRVWVAGPMAAALRARVPWLMKRGSSTSPGRGRGPGVERGQPKLSRSSLEQPFLGEQVPELADGELLEKLVEVGHGGHRGDARAQLRIAADDAHLPGLDV